MSGLLSLSEHLLAISTKNPTDRHRNRLKTSEKGPGGLALG